MFCIDFNMRFFNEHILLDKGDLCPIILYKSLKEE